MQENLFHIEMLKEIFPSKKVKHVLVKGEPTIKVHVESINKKQLDGLFWGVPDSVDINIKRSGKGITIILTNK